MDRHTLIRIALGGLYGSARQKAMMDLLERPTLIAKRIGKMRRKGRRLSRSHSELVTRNIQMWKARKAGETYATIGKRFGVTGQTVAQVYSRLEGTK